MADDKKINSSFVVRIQGAENSTWQGSLLWADQKIKQNFRSALELIKLIDSDLEKRQRRLSFFVR